MTENKVVNLQFPNTDLEELSDEEMESIVGGFAAIVFLVNAVLPGGAPGTVGTVLPGGAPGTVGTVFN
ncbi:bacteriocin [Nostoc sp.]|uniref:bacteriocin n=1 Tax=Nostoc sp. TaxID=1180 RepID=UPI002FF47A3F